MLKRLVVIGLVSMIGFGMIGCSNTSDKEPVSIGSDLAEEIRNETGNSKEDFKETDKEKEE